MTTLTPQQIKQGYSTIPGAYDPLTGKLKSTPAPLVTPTPAVPTPAPVATPIPVPTLGQQVVDGNGSTVTAKFNPNDGTPLTSSQIYNTGSPQQSSALTSQLANTGSYLSGIANTPVDENSIRNQVLQQFQGEIDATNSVYANKLQQAAIQGQGRLGTAGAVQARSGLLGSSFGTAQTNTVQDANNQDVKSIQDEQQLALATIDAEARKAATDAITAKTAARASGTDSYLKYLQDQDTRTNTNTTAAAKYLVAAKYDPSTIPKSVLDTIAKNYGTTSDAITASYTEQKKIQDEADAKVAAQAAKDAKVALPASAQEYEYAKKGGYTGTYSQYQNEDANRKAAVARAGVAKNDAGLTSSQVNTTVNSIAGNFDNEPIVKNFGTISEANEFVKSLPSKVTNPSDDQALVFALAKALDPASVVREGEYATTQRLSQSLISSYGGTISNAILGKGFLSDTARANIKATILERYKASQTNYNQTKAEYQRQIDDAYAGKNRTITDYTIPGASTGANIPQASAGDEALLSQFGL